MPVDREERYQEWLSRMEIPIEATTDIQTLKDYLRDELELTLNPEQEAAIWSTLDKSELYAEHGIHAVTVTYPWGKELRYGVQGLSGLWGWASIQTIMAAEEE